MKLGLVGRMVPVPGALVRWMAGKQSASWARRNGRLTELQAKVRILAVQHLPDSDEPLTAAAIAELGGLAEADVAGALAVRPTTLRDPQNEVRSDRAAARDDRRQRLRDRAAHAGLQARRVGASGGLQEARRRLHLRRLVTTLPVLLVRRRSPRLPPAHQGPLRQPRRDRGAAAGPAVRAVRIRLRAGVYSVEGASGLAPHCWRRLATSAWSCSNCCCWACTVATSMLA